MRNDSRGMQRATRTKRTMTVASQALGATLILMSETLLFTVTKEGMEPVKNIWWCISNDEAASNRGR